MFDWIWTNLVWSEGLSLLVILVLLYVISWWMPFVRYVALIAFLFCFYFFRNPVRTCPQAEHDSSVLICPADGKVVAIEYDAQKGFDGYAYKIALFLSPFDVHVQWIPAEGTIEAINYYPGKFVPAFLPKSSTLNERNDVHLRTKDGKTMMIRQIAGTIARTIRWWIAPRQTVSAGEKYGMIKFGSRVELFLPDDVEIAVTVDQRVYGGQTVVGRWKDDHSRKY